MRSRGRSGNLRTSTALVLTSAVLVLSGCVANVTGPARTYGTYQHKAAATAGAAASSVSTAQLAAQASLGDKAFFPYLSVVMADAEDGLGAVSTTFDAIQPPDARSEEIRSELGDLLTQSGDDVSAVRIAIRRGDRAPLGDLVQSLADDAAALQDFQSEHE